MVEWQFFIEPHLDTLEPGIAPDPTELVKGGQLVTTQTAQAATMSRELRRVGFASDARNLDEAMSAFNKALATLTPAATGKQIEPTKMTESWSQQSALLSSRCEHHRRDRAHISREPHPE